MRCSLWGQIREISRQQIDTTSTHSPQAGAWSQIGRRLWMIWFGAEISRNECMISKVHILCSSRSWNTFGRTWTQIPAQPQLLRCQQGSLQSCPTTSMFILNKLLFTEISRNKSNANSTEPAPPNTEMEFIVFFPNITDEGFPVVETANWLPLHLGKRVSESNSKNWLFESKRIWKTDRRKSAQYPIEPGRMNNEKVYVEQEDDSNRIHVVGERIATSLW